MKMDLATILPWFQILLSVVIVMLVLLQSSAEGGLGGAFGDTGGGRHTKRGSEKILFNATVITSILFGISAITTLVLAS